MSLQNTPVILSKASKRNLRKKDLRATKKAKNEWPDSSIINEHKTQSETRLSTKTQTQEYIRSYWESEDFVASNLKSMNDSQSTFLINPKITFFEKFMERRRQRQVVKTLLSRGLLPSDAVKQNTFSLKHNALSNIDLENIWNELYNPSIDPEKSLPPQTTQVKRAHQQHVKAGKVSLEQTTISEALCQNLKDKQMIASILTDKMTEDDVNIKGYRHIFDPQCFKNALGETMVDLYTFQSSESLNMSRPEHNINERIAKTGGHNILDRVIDAEKPYDCISIILEGETPIQWAIRYCLHASHVQGMNFDRYNYKRGKPYEGGTAICFSCMKLMHVNVNLGPNTNPFDLMKDHYDHECSKPRTEA
ncbi:11657_t:CDS:2, partial [Gigaspora margarita]